MAGKTKKELEQEILIAELENRIRKLSDELYAEKRVEKIVYGFILMLLIAAGGVIVRLVIVK